MTVLTACAGLAVLVPLARSSAWMCVVSEGVRALVRENPERLHTGQEKFHPVDTGLVEPDPAHAGLPL